MQSQYLSLYGAVPERFGQSAKRLAALLVPEAKNICTRRLKASAHSPTPIYKARLRITRAPETYPKDTGTLRKS